jgi:hypothetical protein
MLPTIFMLPTITITIPAALSVSRSRWTSVTRLFEEPHHLLHAPQPFCGCATEVLDDRLAIDPGVDELEDALIPRRVGSGLGAGRN